MKIDFEKIKAELADIQENCSQVKDMAIIDDEKGIHLDMVLWKSHGAKEEQLAWEAKTAFKKLLKKYGWTGEDLEAADADGVDFYRETIKLYNF